MDKRPVLITTEYRGVFFGYLEKTEERPDGSLSAILTDCRNAIYWSEDVKGFLGLAATGPTKGCRIGPAVPRFTALRVTSITDVTPDAVKAWESAPWSK